MYRKKSLSNFVLLALEKAVDGYIRLEDFLYHPGYYAYSNGWEYPLKKSNLSKVLKHLREKGWVEFTDDSSLLIRFTDKGKEKAVLAKILLEEDKWDGRWRMVLFDIPEKRRVVRDVLRAKLKSWGFMPWQQSIWITKKNCTKPLREFIKNVGIKEWVKVLESDDVEF